MVLWLACARAGLIHIPVNFALTGDELLYILNQSGARALFYDPELREAADAVRERAEAEINGTIHGGDGLDVLSVAQSGDEASEPKVNMDEGDLVQILYTSGTTAAPKGAMMTHRAFMAEYMSCIEALEVRHDDRVLHTSLSTTRPRCMSSSCSTCSSAQPTSYVLTPTPKSAAQS